MRAASVEWGCGVDDGEFGTGITCRSKKRRQLADVSHDDGGGIGDAETGPRQGRTLWVEVHQRSGDPLPLAGDGKAARERCFSCSTFPADECNREHG